MSRCEDKNTSPGIMGGINEAGALCLISCVRINSFSFCGFRNFSRLALNFRSSCQRSLQTPRNMSF